MNHEYESAKWSPGLCDGWTTRVMRHGCRVLCEHWKGQGGEPSYVGDSGERECHPARPQGHQRPHLVVPETGRRNISPEERQVLMVEFGGAHRFGLCKSGFKVFAGGTGDSPSLQRREFSTRRSPGKSTRVAYSTFGAELLAAIRGLERVELLSLWIAEIWQGLPEGGARGTLGMEKMLDVHQVLAQTVCLSA